MLLRGLVGRPGPRRAGTAGRTVRLRAKATGRGRVTQTAGHDYDARPTGPTTDQAPAPEQIRMKATASEDGQIIQTGRDRI
ncbi:hypothetical protein [Streptomyces coeruleorubidus]|uniref:hypothetical protein n=1 Tax=Streptomyces coeruleorubidus TaxID=116188 RepID=UPI0033FA1CA8